MSMSLTITGLCLFVPDHDGQRVHVLLPKTSGAHAHIPLLEFEGSNGPEKPSIGGFGLVLTGGGGSSRALRWPASVIEVGGWAAGKKIDLAALASAPTSKLAAWIELPMPDAVSPDLVSLFQIGGSPAHVQLTNGVTWQVNGADPAGIRWEKHVLGSPGTTIKLADRKDPASITATISNRPVNEPGTIRTGDRAPHFHLYFETFFGVTGPEAVLIDPLDGTQVTTRSTMSRRGSDRETGADLGFDVDEEEGYSAFSCMVARAEAQ